MYKQAKEIANGSKNLLRSKLGLTTNEEEVLFNKRREICGACPNMYYDEDLKSDRCRLCGCFLSAKTKSVQSICPEGLW